MSFKSRNNFAPETHVASYDPNSARVKELRSSFNFKMRRALAANRAMRTLESEGIDVASIRVSVEQTTETRLSDLEKLFLSK